MLDTAEAYLPGLDLKLEEAEFEFLRGVVSRNAGIALGPTKRQLVQGRLARRVRELQLSSFKEYCEAVRNGGPEELVALINAITTNVTAFFRESHHFRSLVDLMLPEAMERNAASRKLRLWSAGCSSGEEPYSLAMAAVEAIPAVQHWDLKILATDIDTDIVNTAAQGIFPLERLTAMSEARRRRWFRKGVGTQAGFARVRPELVNLIAFMQLNLMAEWPMRGPFDVIFCRNVMIYFDAATRERILRRFSELLADGGYLCLGHSESIHGHQHGFTLIGRTVYQKMESLAHAH